MYYVFGIAKSEKDLSEEVNVKKMSV